MLDRQQVIELLTRKVKEFVEMNSRMCEEEEFHYESESHAMRTFALWLDDNTVLGE